MKRIVFLLLMGVALVAKAQVSPSAPASIRFGYLSYDSVLCQMPDYVLARQKLADLKAQYEAEQKRVEADFNQKYEAFLEGQKEFPPSILRKRQTELRELIVRRLAFDPPMHHTYLVIQRHQIKSRAAFIGQLQKTILAFAEEAPLLQPVYTSESAQ